MKFVSALTILGAAWMAHAEPVLSGYVSYGPFATDPWAAYYPVAYLKYYADLKAYMGLKSDLTVGPRPLLDTDCFVSEPEFQRIKQDARNCDEIALYWLALMADTGSCFAYVPQSFNTAHDFHALNVTYNGSRISAYELAKYYFSGSRTPPSLGLVYYYLTLAKDYDPKDRPKGSTAAMLDQVRHLIGTKAVNAIDNRINQDLGGYWQQSVAMRMAACKPLVETQLSLIKK